MIKKNQYVLITTKHRGVFFGKLISESQTSAELAEARCAIQFGTTGGFLELARTGPTNKSRIGSEVEHIKVYDITSVTTVTAEAVKSWKQHAN